MPDAPWKNYSFSATFVDGTKQSFLIVAKDDDDAKKKVTEYIVADAGCDGTYSLMLVEPPEVILTGAFGAT